MADKLQSTDVRNVRPRVLLFAYSRSSLGHVVRMATAAQVLMRTGCDVLVACHHSVKRAVQSRGVPWAEIEETAPAMAWVGMDSSPEELRTFVRERLASKKYLTACLKDEDRLIQTFRPNLVISDMRNTASVAASMNGIRSCTVHNPGLFRHPMNIILPEVLDTLAALGIGEEHRHRVLGHAMLIPGIASLDPLSMIPRETAGLICNLVEQVRHIGPLISEKSAQAATWERSDLAQRKGRSSLISVMLGGSGLSHSRLTELVRNLLPLGMNIEVVIPGETAKTPALFEELRALSSTVTVTGYRPDITNLIRASDLTCVHGGHGAITDALVAGTPMLVFPQTAEQHENALRVASLGLGVVVDKNHNSVGVLSAARSAL